MNMPEQTIIEVPTKMPPVSEVQSDNQLAYAVYIGAVLIILTVILYAWKFIRAMLSSSDNSKKTIEQKYAELEQRLDEVYASRERILKQATEMATKNDIIIRLCENDEEFSREQLLSILQGESNV